MTAVIGVDVGIQGAFVVLRNGLFDEMCDMPIVKVNGKSRIDGYAVMTFLVGVGKVDMVLVEDVGSMPGNAAQAMFNFGLGVGVIHGILTAMDRPWAVVRPAKWCGAMEVGSDKGKHRETAMRLFPEDAKLFARVKDDGRADAALIATYAERQLSGR